MQDKQYPALFLIYSSEEARWVDLERSTEYEIGAYRDPADRYSDREGRFGTNEAGKSNKGGEPDVVNARKQDHIVHHMRAIAQKTAEYWREGHYAFFGFIAPEYVKNKLREEIKRYLPPHVPIKEIYGDHIHASPHSLRSLMKRQEELPA